MNDLRKFDDIVKQLEEKYEQIDQDTDDHLYGLLYSKPITYWDYIQTDALLNLQIQRTTLPDEMVFIAYHQINELIFKMILWEIEQVALADLSKSIEEFENELVNRPMKLMGDDSDQLFRVIWLNESKNEWHLAFLFHHIIADGWSLSNVVQEFWQAYLGGSISRPQTEFIDYVNLLASETEADDYEKNLGWWAKYLIKGRDVPSNWQIKMDDQSAGRHKTYRKVLDELATSRLKEQAKANGVTLFHWLLAAYFKTLAKNHGKAESEELSIGVAEGRRDYPLPELNRVVGSMADVFPLILTLEENEQLATVAQKVRDEWLTLSQHTHVPSNKLHELRFSKGSSENHQLYSAAFSL